MRVIRFKKEFIDAIRSPAPRTVIDPITRLPETGLFKTKTTRMTPRNDDEYEVVSALGWHRYLNTGIIIEMVMVELRTIKTYTPDELISDVGHADKAAFLATIESLNTKKVNENTEVYLHTFRVIEVKEMML